VIDTRAAPFTTTNGGALVAGDERNVDDDLGDRATA
jgi:hypothetical protein